jgi:alcohol dehydrogenase class IV
MPAIAPFIYTAHAARVVFGAGSIQHLEREIDALGFKRALVLSTPEQRDSAEMDGKKDEADVYVLTFQKGSDVPYDQGIKIHVSVNPGAPLAKLSEGVEPTKSTAAATPPPVSSFSFFSESASFEL